jgi:hypothetical protein
MSQYKLNFHIFIAPHPNFAKFWILGHFEHFHTFLIFENTPSQIFLKLFLYDDIQCPRFHIDFQLVISIVEGVLGQKHQFQL